MDVNPFKWRISGQGDEVISPSLSLSSSSRAACYPFTLCTIQDVLGFVIFEADRPTGLFATTKTSKLNLNCKFYELHRFEISWYSAQAFWRQQIVAIFGHTVMSMSRFERILERKRKTDHDFIRLWISRFMSFRYFSFSATPAISTPTWSLPSSLVYTNIKRFVWLRQSLLRMQTR